MLRTIQVGSMINIDAHSPEQILYGFWSQEAPLLNFSKFPSSGWDWPGLHCHLSKEPQSQTEPMWNPVSISPFGALSNLLPNMWSQLVPRSFRTHAYRVHPESQFQEGGLASKSLQLAGTVFLSWNCVRLYHQNIVDAYLEWIKLCI